MENDFIEYDIEQVDEDEHRKTGRNQKRILINKGVKNQVSQMNKKTLEQKSKEVMDNLIQKQQMNKISQIQS